MPEVNFNLLAPTAELYSGPQVQMDPVAAYEKAKATRQSNMLAQLYAKHYDPQTGGVNYNALIPEAAQSGLDVSQLMPGVREQQESMASIAQKDALRRQEEATAAAKQQEMFKANVDTAMKWSRSQLDSIKTPDEYLKWHEANHTNPYLAEFFKQNNISKEDRRSEINSLLSQEGGLQKLIDMSKQGLDNYLGVKPAETKQFQPTAFESEFALYKQDPAAYRRFKEAQKVETGGGAKATETVDDTGITKAERNKREAAYPKVAASYRGAVAEIDTLASDLAALRNHPGLSKITGFVAGQTINITPEARAAQALLDKILARGQFRELQNMRVNSPTGGALGNVSDTEGQNLRKAFGAFDQKQDTPDFQNAIDAALNQLQFSKQNIASQFEDTYAYRSGGTPSAPAADGKAQLSPQDQAALDWANKNPKDPRAAQIKAKLGVK